MVLPPKGNGQTAEDNSSLASADVQITEEVGVTVLGVSIGTEEYAVERARGAARDEGADSLLRFYLAGMPDEQANALIATEPLGQRTSYLERVMGTGTSLEA